MSKVSASLTGITDGGADCSAALSVRTNLWYNWTVIAVEHERLAIDAGKQLQNQLGAPGAGVNIASEMHPTMVSIVAAAFSIDALHADVAKELNLTPDARRGKKKRQKQWERMLETFKVVSASAADWRGEWGWLFHLRDNAAHFKSEFRKPVRHPVLPTNVSLENATFSMKSATRAVDVVQRLHRTMAAEAPANSKLVEWIRGIEPALKYVEQIRRVV